MKGLNRSLGLLIWDTLLVLGLLSGGLAEEVALTYIWITSLLIAIVLITSDIKCVVRAISLGSVISKLVDCLGSFIIFVALIWTNSFYTSMLYFVTTMVLIVLITFFHEEDESVEEEV